FKSNSRTTCPAPVSATYTDPSGASAMKRGPFSLATTLTWNPVGMYSTPPGTCTLSMPAGGPGAAARSLRQPAASRAAASTARPSPPLSVSARLLPSIRHPPDLAGVVVGDEQRAVRQHQQADGPAPARPRRGRARRQPAGDEVFDGGRLAVLNVDPHHFRARGNRPVPRAVQRHERVAPVVGGEHRAGVKGKPARRGSDSSQMLHEEPTATYSLLSGPTTTVRVECPCPLGSVASFRGVAAPGLKRSSASVSPTYIVSPRNARPNGWCRPSATVIT